jgi:hypothetical protein
VAFWVHAPVCLHLDLDPQRYDLDDGERRMPEPVTQGLSTGGAWPALPAQDEGIMTAGIIASAEKTFMIAPRR